jgi:hypothetical protein
MRSLALIALAALPAALSLAACASDETPTDASYPARGGYLSEQDRLRSDCDRRGGILVPTGRSTGQPATENVCKITGPSADLPPTP